MDQSQNFWTFSLALYDREGVADACLKLQTDAGIDVNMLLFCYWHAMLFGEFSNEVFASALRYSQSWKQEVVQPLRNIRHWLKANALDEEQGDRHSQIENLRQRVKEDELAAEKIQHEALERLVRSAEKVATDSETASAEIASIESESAANPSPGDAARKNIQRLFAAMSLELTATILVHVEAISSEFRRLDDEFRVER